MPDFIEPKAGRYVCVKVTGSGSASDEAVQKRIFEPFYY